MKYLDLIYVAFNSSKWIEKCFESILMQDYDLNYVSVYVIDNLSNDNTIEKLRLISSRMHQKIRHFEIIESDSNLGFGQGNNIAFSRGESEIACFFNIDTELPSDCLTNLVQDIENSDQSMNFALWELRQFPYEHPKRYDPITHETSWSSGAAFAIKRDVFSKIGGFDKKIFMYAEDVDLSWRLRAYGYRLKYVPKAIIYHYSYATANEIKPTQYVNSIINNMLLRYRFGSIRDILIGKVRFWHIMCGHGAFYKSRRMLLTAYLKHFSKLPYFLVSRYKVGKSKDFHATFYGYDYTTNRDGAFYENARPLNKPLVSILIRTCGRPNVLRETLKSLRWQTYDNFEVVIAEDGENISQKMIETEFTDLNIKYWASGEKVGRSKAGNKAMELATGQYFNFLDDDDVFYADHIETLVTTLNRNPQVKVAYAFAFETPITIESRDPYKYKIKDYLGTHKQEFNKIMLCHHNYLPIQSIMFERQLFDNYGGFDESLNAIEDWDMWVRYSLHTDFACIKKTTSEYRTPYQKNENLKRQKELDDALKVVREKHKGYINTVSVYDIAMLYEMTL